MTTATTVQRRRRHIKRILRERNRYQFGQPRRTTSKTGFGAVGCTDTCIQLIVLMWTGNRVSQNEVRRRAGAPVDGSRGLRPSESLKALRSFGLDYRLADISAAKALHIARVRGPVIIGYAYWSHPQWRGYRYAGKTLRGWALNRGGRRVRVGFARPSRKSGLTQWTFRGNHATLIASSYVSDGNQIGILRDPNHNSPVRPERPSWDEVTVHQVRRMADSIRPDFDGHRLFLVPADRLKV